MYNFFHILANEANPKLTDKSNNAIQRLLSKNHRICSYEATFHKPSDYYKLGIVEFKDKSSVVLTAFYSIYIQQETVYVRLLTLDKVLLLDTPYRSFFHDLKNLLSVSLDNADSTNRRATLV